MFDTPSELRWQSARLLAGFAGLQVAFMELWRYFYEGTWSWFLAAMLLMLGCIVSAFAIGAIVHLGRSVYGRTRARNGSAPLLKFEHAFLGHFAVEWNSEDRLPLIAATLVSFGVLIFEFAVIFATIGVVDRVAFNVAPLHIPDALLLSIEIATGNYGDILATGSLGKVFVAIEMLASLAYLVFVLALAADAMRNRRNA